MFLALPRRRRIALANLDMAFPERSSRERRRVARESCRHLGLVFVELCRLLARPLDDVLGRIDVEGLAHLDSTMAAYGRALVLSAHLGNWELLSVAHRLTSYPLAVVVRPLDRSGLNAVAERARMKTGVDLIDKRNALRPTIRALARGGLVGILLDQNTTRGESVFVPFFGRLASTSKAIAVLALRTGAPILPVFTRRMENGRHRVVIQRPIVPPSGQPTDEAIVALTGECAAAIEAAVRETPEQWLWLHDRWRTRPKRRL
jgi:KDO2-lipid IV(A) lauroyltransferase